jgi:hypothetical protein
VRRDPLPAAADGAFPAAAWRVRLNTPAVSSGRRHSPLPPSAAATALAAAILLGLVFPRLLFGDVLFRRDVHLMWYTQTEAFVRAVHAGEWPLWNPDIGFGQPLWADANVQVVYPPTWLNLLVKPWTYYTAFVIAHLLVAALGARALARVLGLGRFAAAAAGLLWLVSGPLLSLAEIWNQLAGAAWMPWALAAAVRAIATGRRSWAVAWGAATAAQVLAGSPESVLLTSAGALAYWILARLCTGGGMGGVVRTLSLPLIAVAVAMGLSAAQWLPSVAAASESGRAHLAPEARGYWSVHPIAMIQLLLPLAADALRLAPRAAGVLFGGRDPLLPSLYLGLTTVPLAVAALVARRRRPALCLLAAVAGCLLVAAGEHLPIHRLLAAALPPLRALRYPVKAMPAAALCWALLCGIGLDAWAEARASERRWMPIVLAASVLMAAVAAAAAIATHVRADAIGARLLAEGSLGFAEMLRPTRDALTRAALGGLAVTLIAFARMRLPGRASLLTASAAVVALADLVLAHRGLAPTAPRALFTIRPPILDAARPPDHGRLYAYDYFSPGLSAARLGRDDPFLIARAPRAWPVAAAGALAMRTTLFPPTAAPWGVAGSFDHDTPGIAPWRSAVLVDTLLGIEGTAAHARLLSLGAVSRVVALHRRGLEGLPIVAQAEGFLPEPALVYAVPGAGARAYAVGEAVVAHDDQAALRTVLDPAFDPARTVVLAGTAEAAGDGSHLPGLESTVRLDRVGADRMGLDAVLSGPGFVVLADAWTPGWSARVDGRPARVLRANVGFRAVPVPAGHHHVELRYRAPGLRLGLVVSAVTLAVLLGTALRSRRRSPEPVPLS